ncbi:MAG: glutaredoxin domain-containing protein [Candidatus Aenigmatarchaeota archaeon]
MPKKAAKSVKLYTTEWCPYCKTAKEFLKEKGVKFEEFRVDKDQKAAKRMVEISGQSGVPVLHIGSAVIVGFDAEKIRKALGLKN